VNEHATTLFVNASEIVTAAGPARARRGPEMHDAGVRTGCAVAVVGDTIAAVGPETDVRAAFPHGNVVDCAARVLTPGLVDSHTHAVFGAGRFMEHELRAQGVPYFEIAKRGGGIHASVRDVRSRSEDELLALAVPRIERLMASGVTTVEIKSGYGLSRDAEMRMLRVIRRLAETMPCRVVATYLGAHEIPLEYRERENGRSDYVSAVCSDIVEVARLGLADFADVFCEPGAFTVDESRTILRAAAEAGLARKIHADEFAWSGGAELAVEMDATSADHLAAISDEGIAALVASNTVATLLPATMVFVGTGRHAPARALLDAGAAVALATDFNPGSSPLANVGIVLTLAVSELSMRVSEALLAVTVNGAAAVRGHTRFGQIAPGFSADLALWDVTDHREIPYWFGERLCVASWTRGKSCLRPVKGRTLFQP
jgi:imidazolonepropionase